MKTYSRKTNRFLNEDSNREKLVIYKGNRGYEVTPQSNFNKRISNARLIQKLDDFSSPKEIIDYYVKWFGSEPEDFIIDGSINESSGAWGWQPESENEDIEYYGEDVDWGLSDSEKNIIDTYLNTAFDLFIFKKDGVFYIEDSYDTYECGPTKDDLINNIKYTFSQWKEDDPEWYDEFVSPYIEESLRESRYSDVYDDDRRNQGWWYFTTHGVQPGSIPKDLNVLEVKDGKNDKGTLGTFVKLDGILNTSELKQFDMKELVPDDSSFSENLKEDTVKQNNKWVNKGKEGTHGTFKTKKEADAQRRAIWVNWNK